MIAAALEHLRQLAVSAEATEGRTGNLDDGREFFSRTREIVEPASPASLGFSTLRSLACYLSAKRDGLDLSSLVFHVEGPALVRIVGALDGVYFTRRSYAQAAPPAAPPMVPFGQYLDAETFTIWLLTGFVQDEQTESIMKLVGNLKAEKVSTLSEDGVTQVATVRTGVVRSGEAAIHNPVILRPWRTFPELEQPASPFVLRLRDGKDGSAPTIALFASADTRWMGEAMASAAHYLQACLEELGVESVPVLE